MKSTLIKLPIITSVLLCIAFLLGKFMPSFVLLKLLHVLAFITLGSGLIGVVVSDLRARRAADFPLLVDSIEAMLGFYYRLVVPGSMLILLSGFSMVFGYYGWSFMEIPWLAGMMVLFVFEFFEGHLIMKFHYLKLKQGILAAKQANAPVPELEHELRARLTLATHFLDVPNFTLIVVLGIVRPTDWTLFSYGLVLVVAVTTWMAVVIPKRHPWKGLRKMSPVLDAHAQAS
ncbi:DUF2269 family protein [Hydrogenophaga sp.]|uniref:DUF2269 family protein n=1 Tax=Hydrogenophaga sp. TaxID=1904254 RepID=UPI0035676643